VTLYSKYTRALTLRMCAQTVLGSKMLAVLDNLCVDVGVGGGGDECEEAWVSRIGRVREGLRAQGQHGTDSEKYST
jgi:hypothetical protein